MYKQSHKYMSRIFKILMIFLILDYSVFGYIVNFDLLDVLDTVENIKYIFLKELDKQNIFYRSNNVKICLMSGILEILHSC